MRDALERIWRPDWPCPVAAILAPGRRGPGDPTYRIVQVAGRAGRPEHWRGIRTPQGPATLVITRDAGAGVVRGQAYGPGAAWALEAMPRMLGADDDPSGFDPRHPVLAAVWHRHRHWRLGSTGLVMESLVPTIIEQRVTGQEAFSGFRRLVRRFGEPAPGPGEQHDLWVQPAPEVLRRIASWDWLQLHIDSARSRPLVRAAASAAALERAGLLEPEEFGRRLVSLPGVGVWTSAEVRARALGDADAVSFGDYHVAKDVGWVLVGREVDDAGLAEILAAYRPHRHRVQYLVGAAGLGRPRRGPRMAARTHLP